MVLTWIVLVQWFSTAAMVGLIWFVQIVHYPLFAKVGAKAFSAYEESHQRRTSLVVMPFMLAEALTAVLLLFVPPSGTLAIVPIVGTVLLALLWASTVLLQVPAHASLSRGFDDRVWRRLVNTNWIRTIAWTARGVLVTVMAYDHLVAISRG